MTTPDGYIASAADLPADVIPPVDGQDDDDEAIDLDVQDDPNAPDPGDLIEADAPELTEDPPRDAEDGGDDFADVPEGAPVELTGTEE